MRVEKFTLAWKFKLVCIKAVLVNERIILVSEAARFAALKSAS